MPNSGYPEYDKIIDRWEEEEKKRKETEQKANEG